MMRQFFENKFAFIAIFLLFVAAFTWNTSQGVLAPAAGILLEDPSGPALVAHGPSMPPDPWDGTLKAA